MVTLVIQKSGQNLLIFSTEFTKTHTKSKLRTSAFYPSPFLTMFVACSGSHLSAAHQKRTLAHETLRWVAR